MSWVGVKDMIEDEIDRIFWDEPEEITMCKKGIFPSGASVGGQVLGNLVFLIADARASTAINRVLPEVKTKDELEDLLWSWFNYVDCLNRWFFLVFPWHLGKEFQIVKPEDIAELDRLSKHWE